MRPGTDGALALGLANVMIERGWYDRDFIREWSNGPHLVRADTGRLLTARDLDPNGDARRILAWDSAAARLVPYDPTTGRYDGDSARLALTANTGSPHRRARSSATRPSSSTRGSAGATRRRPSRRSAGFRAPRSRRPRD